MKGIPVILYNALGFQVNHTVEVEVDMPGSPGGISVFDAKGTKVPSQLLSYNDGKARILVDATVPAVGYACMMCVFPVIKRQHHFLFFSITEPIR